MVTNMQNRWAVAGSTFLVWALVAGSTVYWGLKMSARSVGVAAAPLASHTPAAADPVAVARLLGAGPAATVAAPSLASRFALVGVVANASRQGAALISVDGKPAKPYRVGATVEEGLVLQSVQSRRAVLGEKPGGPPVLTLDLPQQRK